jgi:hypothetical protein
MRDLSAAVAQVRSSPSAESLPRRVIVVNETIESLAGAYEATPNHKGDSVRVAVRCVG